jgi:hypothetical protein
MDYVVKVLEMLLITVNLLLMVGKHFRLSVLANKGG